MNKKGLTLVEIVVSIALLGMIAVATLPLLTFGYVHLFGAQKYTVDTFAVQQDVEEQMEVLRTQDITAGDPEFTIFGKTITGHLLQMDIQASLSDPAHGEISVFVPKYKVIYTVPVVSEGSVSVNPYRDGVLIPQADWGSIFPLASPESEEFATPSSYVTLKASNPVVSDDEFLMNVYRWYMSPVTDTTPAKRDLILIKEWNAARAPLSFEDSEDMTYIPNVEANYDELDFRDFFSYLGLPEEELCQRINDTFGGRYFYYSVTPYSTIGRVGVEEFSQEIIAANKIMSIDDVYDIASIGVKYYPNEHYPEVQAQMQNGALLDVPVVWSPAELDISEEGLQTSHGTVIGFTPGVTFHLTVQHIPLEGISIEEAKTVGVNDIFTIDVTYDPESATNKNITWSSSDENIVSTMENPGSLTAKNVGTAIITATAADGGYTDTCVVTVIPTQLYSISISGARSVGTTLTTALDPAGATATYQWSRSDTFAGTYQGILGATSDTYTLTAADAGKYIRVTATGTGNYTGSVYSTAGIGGDTGWVSASGNSGNNGVSNPNYAYSSDNQRATFNSNGERVDYSFGSLSVPQNATITGIEVRIEARKASNANRTFNLSLYDYSTLRGAAKNSGSLSNTDTYYYFGGTSDNWGYTGWTEDKINSALRVRVQCSNGSNSIYLNHIQIKVYYTMPE